MKKKINFRSLAIMAIFFAMSAIHHAHAQSKVTVHGSVGASDIEVNGLGILDIVDPYIKPITQYAVGIQYERNLTRQLSFATGAQYASRGFGAREDFNVNLFGLDIPIGARLESRLNYVEVPLILKYDILDGGVTPYVKAGISTAYAINGKITPKVDAIITWKLPAININLENDMFNRFDVSAIAGAGVSIPVNSFGSIQIEANYRHSLNDMFLDSFTNIRIKSHGISGGVGYSIRF
jgi:opacity protein-like surface antigen